MLRLKQYVASDLLPPHMDAILDALAVNTRVEVLYIQNFERVSDISSKCAHTQDADQA